MKVEARDDKGRPVDAELLPDHPAEARARQERLRQARLAMTDEERALRVLKRSVRATARRGPAAGWGTFLLGVGGLLLDAAKRKVQGR